MHKDLHPRDYEDRQCMSRKEERRGFDSIQDSVNASLQRREDYRKKCGERLITTTRNNTENTSIKNPKSSKKTKRIRKTTV